MLSLEFWIDTEHRLTGRDQASIEQKKACDQVAGLIIARLLAEASDASELVAARLAAVLDSYLLLDGFFDHATDRDFDFLLDFLRHANRLGDLLFLFDA